MAITPDGTTTANVDSVGSLSTEDASGITTISKPGRIVKESALPIKSAVCSMNLKNPIQIISVFRSM